MAKADALSRSMVDQTLHVGFLMIEKTQDPMVDCFTTAIAINFPFLCHELKSRNSTLFSI